MVTAVVLFDVEREKVNEIGETLAGLDGITEVYSVGGNHDLVAICRVPNNEDLADLVTRQIADITGITNTETMIAFRTYSRHDLERMFSIGLE